MRAVSLIKNQSLVIKNSLNRFISLSRSTFADNIRDKEVAEEKFYFDKEERRLAENLLKKLKVEIKNETPDEVTFKQKERLKVLFASHKEQLPHDLLEDLIKWKNEGKH